MKKVKNKQGKTSQKIKTKKQSAQVIIVKNAEGDADTKAQILVQNKINYTPKVSVIIPVYNVEAYLRQCLDSVIKQTLEEIEIICVDDGSTDNSLEILKEYAAKDKRITILKQKNLHAGVARNAGLAVARGEYLSFLDSDDFFELNMLEETYKKITEDSSDIVIFGSFVYDQLQKADVRKTMYAEKFVQKSPFAPQDFAQDLFLISNPNAWTKLFKRETVRKNKVFFESLSSCNDITFVNTMLTLAHSISLMNTPYVHYRINTKINISANRGEKVICFVYAIKKLKDNLIKYRTYNLYKDTLETRTKKSFNWELTYCTPQQKAELQKQSVAVLGKDYTQNPKVSVIVPVYNTAEFLPKCLDSVINQTLKDIEIICINDGSTDNSLEILQKYARQDSRIIIINQENQGLSCSRNNALKIAKGEYVQFLDSDDWLRLDSLMLLYRKATQTKADMVHFEGISYYVDTQEFEQPKGLKIQYVSDVDKVYSYKDIQQFILNIPISSCLFFYRNAFLRENNFVFPEGLCFEDNYFLHQALNSVARYVILKEVLYHRTKHSNQITANWDKHIYDYIEIVRLITQFYASNSNTQLASAVINQYCGALCWRYKTLLPATQIKCHPDILKLLKQIPPTIALAPSIVKFIKEEPAPDDTKKQLSTWYQKVTGKYLNLDNPRTFNEKLQWLKLYDSTPFKTRLADKYLVRDWIKEKIGEEYLIPLLGVYDRFDDIDFNKLPNQFVIKCNHGSGWNIIVKDKSQLNLAEAKEKIDKWMAADYSTRWGFELHYKNITPKIIIEEYIDPVFSNHEIQCWVFNKEIKFVSVETIKDTDNLERGTFYLDGTPTEFEISPGHYKRMDKITSKKAFDKAIKLARELVVDVSYVRIDFIEYADDVRFREMTFTSGSGLSVIKPEKYNLKLGDMIKLPELAYNMDTGEYYKLPKKSKIKPYLLFPYYLWQKAHLERQKESYIEKLVVSQLSSSRIDIKNVGKENNAVEISTTEKVSAPAWFKNAQGQGQVLESNKERCQISIKVIQSGKLVLSFKSQDKRYEGGRFPLWVNYKSIKINGKEILSAPVETWHDKPFRYEMPVRDGQSIVVEIELQPHQYSKEELENIILKLFPNNEYIKQNMIHFLKHCAAFIKPTVKKPFHLFGITKTETSRTVYLFGLPLTFKNKHKEVLASLQQNQQSLLRAVKAVEDHNSRLEQQNAALSQQVNVMNRELQQSKLWIKQTYEAFPTINKQLLNAQNALLSQLVTERKVNRLAAIVSAVVKKQRKHNQEMQALLSKFISDTQFDLKYLKKVDVAKRAHLQQATDKLAQQMQSAAQIQEKQLAGMQELLVSGQSTLQYLKGLDVAKTEHLQQSADKLAQQMQSAAQIQEKQLAGMQKLLVSGHSTLQYLKGLDVAKTEHLQQAADKLAQQMQSAAQMQEKQLAGMQELLLSGQATLQYLKGVDVAKTEHVQQSADKLAQQMQSAAQMQEKQLTGMRELLLSGQSALQHLKGLNVVNPEQLQQTTERLLAQITGASQAQTQLLTAVSGSLRQQQQEASSQAGHIVGSLETLQKNHKTEQEDIKKQLRTIQDKSLQQYRELNFADLLHDSTKHSPWLKDRSFALYGWAANYSFIYTLFRILDKVSPQHILEMGLGQTTRLTTQYIAYKNPSATLDVCEHNQDWIDIYTPELPKSGNIKVHHLDLEYFDYDGKPNDKYKNISGVCGGTKYNLIIVDGPVGGGKNFPRSNVVDLIPHNLAEDFIIIFDDAERPGEQNTIAQTKAKLTAQGIVFATQQRSALKSQFLIFSKSCEFVQYL